MLLDAALGPDFRQAFVLPEPYRKVSAVAIRDGECVELPYPVRFRDGRWIRQDTGTIISDEIVRWRDWRWHGHKTTATVGGDRPRQNSMGVLGAKLSAAQDRKVREDEPLLQSIRAYLPIPSYPEYEINREGEVRIRSTGYKLAFCQQGNSLRRVNLQPTNGGKLNHAVAAALLETFVGAAPEGMTTPIHIDGNRSNLALSNLRWGTRADSRAGSGNKIPREPGQPTRSKLTKEQALEIRTSPRKVTILAEEYGVSCALIYQIRRGIAYADCTDALERPKPTIIEPNVVFGAFRIRLRVKEYREAA